MAEDNTFDIENIKEKKMRIMIFNKLQSSILNGIVIRPLIRLQTYCATPSQVTICPTGKKYYQRDC
jgi:hypothetical protein